VTPLDPEGRDPGLAAERTDLAWHRSGLSLLACGAVIMRGLSHPPFVTQNLALGACVLGLGAFIWALGAWHAKRVTRLGNRRTRTIDLVPVALGVAIVGIVAFVLAARFPN
jgi:uncharacterized membrane protein YidH (DUF202 family)